MAKDPAFLFYPGDWLGGTTTFTRAHKGAYMDLLMAQYNDGHLNEEDIRQVLGADYELMWPQKLRRKFKTDPFGLYYNEKLENEMIKRKLYTKSRQDNLLGKKNDMASHKEALMENENENINTDVIANAKKKFVRPELDDVTNYFCIDLDIDPLQAQCQAEAFLDYYTSNGWKVGKNAMKDWKAACRNWKKNMLANTRPVFNGPVLISKGSQIKKNSEELLKRIENEE